jgi:adenylate kinase
MQDSGELRPDADPEELAVGLMAAVQGGYLLVKTTRDERSMAIALDMALDFETSLPMIIRRLSGRRLCPKCSKNYHVRNYPPKKEGICDLCGSELVQRPDDREEAIETRLKLYKDVTEPLIQYYRASGRLIQLDGDIDVAPLNVILMDLFRKKGLCPK